MFDRAASAADQQRSLVIPHEQGNHRMNAHQLGRALRPFATRVHDLLHRLEDSPEARRKRERELLEAALERGFLEMSEKARVQFLLRNLELIPAKFWARSELARVRWGKLDYPRGDIYLRVTSMQELRRCAACAKEPWTVEWIEHWIQPGDVLFDIGANVGAYSLVAASHTVGQARVYAFEPAYHTYAALCDNIVRNGFADCITPLPVALSDATTLVRFDYRALRPGTARHRLVNSPADANAETREFAPAYSQPVLAYRLDDVIALHGLPRPNHLKLDVDGAEVAVLEGARETLAGPEVISLMIEVHVHQAERVVALLESLGFRLDRKHHELKQERLRSIWYGLFAREVRAQTMGEASSEPAGAGPPRNAPDTQAERRRLNDTPSGLGDP